MSKGRIVGPPYRPPQPTVCAVCGAPAGQVTLMNIDGKGCVCFGGDCQKQKLVAMKRLLRRTAAAGRRLQRAATAAKPAGKPKKQQTKRST